MLDYNNDFYEKIVIFFVNLALIFAPMDAWLILPVNFLGILVSIPRILIFLSVFVYVILSLKKGFISLNFMLLLVFIWSMIYILSIFWIDISIERSLILRKLFSIIFANFLIYLGYICEKFNQTLRVFKVITFISLIFALIEQIFGFRPYIERQHLFIFELTSFYINPAHLGSTLALLYPCVKYYFSNKRYELIGYVLDFIVLFVIIRTGSKGALLSFLFCFIAMVFVFKDIRKKFLMNVIFYVSFVISGWYFVTHFRLVPDILLDKINIILVTPIAIDSYLNRYEIYTEMLKYISRKPILGYGLGTNLIVGTSSHNFWLELWFEGGIINFVAFILIYIILLHTLIFKKINKESKIYLISLVAFIPISLTVGSIFSLWIFWILLGASIYRIS